MENHILGGCVGVWCRLEAGGTVWRALFIAVESSGYVFASFCVGNFAVYFVGCLQLSNGKHSRGRLCYIL
jgi:hypothetical protein